MLQLIQEVRYLLQKDLILEWRQRYALSGIMLYIVSCVVVVYMSFMAIEPIAWVTVLWIIMLFASVNAVAKSFVQEDKSVQLYYYTLVSPQAIIIAKIIYNVLLLCLIAVLGLGIYILLLGNPVEDIALFALALLLGVSGFAMCFTLVSAIAAKANSSAALMPILSFPLIIPMLGLLIGLSKTAMLGVESTDTAKDIANLLAMDAGLLVLSVILFPYLWRD